MALSPVGPIRVSLKSLGLGERWVRGPLWSLAPAQRPPGAMVQPCRVHHMAKPHWREREKPRRRTIRGCGAGHHSSSASSPSDSTVSSCSIFPEAGQSELWNWAHHSSSFLPEIPNHSSHHFPPTRWNLPPWNHWPLPSNGFLLFVFG